MKGGKEDEKTMGPMFPRLHVNDTAEKGGPRAPPRNKMALYEQLSIPSHRFGSSLVPINPHSNPSFAPSASSSQVSGGVDRNLISRQSCASTTSTWSEKFDARHNLDGANGTASTASFDRRKRGGDEDDFRVPVFVQPRPSKRQAKVQNNIERETVSSITTSQPLEWRNTLDVGPKDGNLTETEFGRESRNGEINGNIKSSGRDGVRTIISATNQSLMETSNDGRAKEAKISSVQRYFGRFSDGETLLHPKTSVGTKIDGSRKDENLVESRRDDKPLSETRCVEDHNRPNEPENNGEHNGNGNRLLLVESADKGDDVSEISMEDYKTDLVISPDEVVGIIGQKYFWKARKAIDHQQRVFAVQVFELHRLIKVQRLIAGSPHFLLDDGAFPKKSTSTGSPAKSPPPASVAKLLPVVANCKDDSEKTSYKKESSAGNAVEKSSVSSVKNGDHSVNYGPYMAHPQPVVNANNNKMGPWGFHQPPGPQWLVPVMSPSEGLVYKPYLGPLPGAVYGGYGPLGPNPVTGNYTNSGFGISASQPHGIMGFHGPSPAGHTYLPYGMPFSNPAMSASGVDQASTGAGINLHTEQQTSCTAPTQKNEKFSKTQMLRASKGSDLQQGSTPSSRCEMAKGAGIGHNNEGTDPLPLFPLAPMAEKVSHQTHVDDQPIRAIKVVPHNPRSATESAARIFRFIQEERKQFDSV